MSKIHEKIAETQKLIDENKATYLLEKAIEELKAAKDTKPFEDAITKLSSYSALEESEIREKILSTELYDHMWIASIKNLVKKIQILENKKIQETTFGKPKITKISEKLDLFSKINALYETVGSDSVKMILRRYSSQVGYARDIVILNNLLREMKAYDWIDSVNSFINEMNQFIQNNNISYLVDETIHRLQLDRSALSFKPAIDKLVEMLVELDEAEITETMLKERLSTYLWIPQIKQLVYGVEIIEKQLNSIDSNASINKVYSPILTTESEKGELFTFYLSGKIYSISENNEILEEGDISKLTNEFRNLVSVVETFSFTSDSMRLSHKNLFIEIKPIDENTTEVYVNNRLVENDNLERYLKSTGAFQINEMQKLNVINFAANNIKKIVELDFIDSINSRLYRGVQVNILKLDENIYINRINVSMGKNEFVKATSGKNAIELVKEYINYDISSKIVDILESDESNKIKLNAKKKEIQAKLDYLNEEIEKLDKLGLDDNERIQKAKKILSDGIDEQKRELNRIFKADGVTVREKMDDTFVDGILKMKVKGFNAGTKIKVDAEDYTSSGAKEMVNIMLPSNEKVDVQKKFIEVNI